MGARMGSVLALLLAVVLVVACGGAGFTARNFMHSRLVPGMLDLAVQQTADRMTASGTPLPPDWATAMHWPEMRAGAFLLLQVFLSALLLLVGTVSGAAAGALLGARQRRNRT